MIRVHGDLYPLPDYEPLTADDTAALIRGRRQRRAVGPLRARPRARPRLRHSRRLSRFRVNLLPAAQRLRLGDARDPARHQAAATNSASRADQPFAHLPRGLVLVTGPTGSGKTTTLASLLDLANRTRRDHIVTIEDPIEFLHHHKRCVVNQREVGVDTDGFATALKHVLRQDPDIILVGEMRDLETVSTAITAAETGHLVLATLHTQSAAQTIDRVIDIFPPHQQQEIRAQLSTALQGIVTQALCRRADGAGRTVVCEVMFATPAIRNLIREGKNHQIPSFMQSSGADGMLTFDQHLAQRVSEQADQLRAGPRPVPLEPEFTRLAGRA